ncbi:LMBR1 domain-containing protein 2 [Spathaspora sp. JA1]|nr:LMBR1 domain-containing protein 2 [Spathaspora sp. JA1]
MSIIFLLPLDYVSHNSTSELVWFNLPDSVIQIIWKVNYWTTFALTWLVLPMLLEFYRSGHNNNLDKVKDSIRANLKFQAIMLGVSILGVIYLMVEVGLSPSHLKMMIIALSHVYSLILALWLMAHGLITIPRNKWISGNIGKDLNFQYLKLPKLVDELEDVKISFREQVLIVVSLTRNFTSDSIEDFKYRDWILKLYNSIPGDLKENVERQFIHENINISRNELTDSFMTKLNSNFNSNLHRLIGYQSEYNNLFKRIIRLEDTLNSVGTRQLTFRVDNHKVLFPPKINFLYWYYYLPFVNRITSIFLFIASFILLQSEFFHSTKLSLLNHLIYSTGIINHPILQFIISSLVFSYMLFCGLDSLTHLKIFNMYHLVARESDPVSASWYTMYIARLTIPLSYNFITLFISRESIFEKWFGESIHLTGLFNLLNNWIPRLVLIPVILAVFQVYDKIKKRLGFSDLYDSWALFDDDQEQDGNRGDLKRQDLIIVEAKRIINREMSKREIQLRPFNLRHEDNLADLNYQTNRRQFQDVLVDNINNRVDQEEQEEETYFNGTIISPESNSVWSRLGSTFSSIRDNVNRTIGRGSNDRRNYRDEEPLDDFNYDDDANENLII